MTITTTPPSNLSFLQEAFRSAIDPSKFRERAIEVGVIALPIITAVHCGFQEELAIGWGAGVCIFTAALGFISVLEYIPGAMQPEDGSEYEEFLLEEPKLTVLGVPIIEETACYILRHVTTRSILWVIPTTEMALLSSEFTVATTAATLSTAALFGLSHYSNPHKNSHIQAIILTGSGVAFGSLATQISLPVAIVAHMTNNACAWVILRLS